MIPCHLYCERLWNDEHGSLDLGKISSGLALFSRAIKKGGVLVLEDQDGVSGHCFRWFVVLSEGWKTKVTTN